MTPKAAEILEIAKRNDGRYLLPRRFSTGTSEITYYKAAQELVTEGLARWLDQSSTFYPGIVLTSKAYFR
jgi:hypothetical protein